MPKRVKNPAAKKKPSSDPMIRSRQLMDEHLAKMESSLKPWDRTPEPAEVSPPHGDTFAAQLSAHMAKIGSKGGKIGGAKRRQMPPAERSAIALKAAKARWAKRKD